MNHVIRKVGAFNVFAAIISVLGVALIMARNFTYGAVLQYDSIVYISTARNLLAGEGFSGMSGFHLSGRAPFYPLLLAAASMGIWDPLDVAGLVNAIIFGLTIFVVGRYLWQSLTSRFLAVWACLVIALSIPLARTASWVLSDSLFILLASLTLIYINKYLAVGRLSFLIWAAVFSGLAWFTREIGVTVPLLVGLLLLFQPNTQLMERARRIAVFSLFATLPMVLWHVRDYLLFGKSFGNYRQIDITFPTLLQQTIDILTDDWLYLDRPLVPWPSLEWFPVASALLLLIVLFVAFTGWIFAENLQRKHVTVMTGAHYVFGGFAAVYFVLLFTASIIGHTHHGIEERYLDPLYIPLLVVAVLALDRLLVRPLAVVLMMVLPLLVIGQIVPNIDQIVKANSRNSDTTMAHFNRRTPRLFNGSRIIPSMAKCTLQIRCLYILATTESQSITLYLLADPLGLPPTMSIYPGGGRYN